MFYYIDPRIEDSLFAGIKNNTSFKRVFGVYYVD